MVDTNNQCPDMCATTGWVHVFGVLLPNKSYNGRLLFNIKHEYITCLDFLSRLLFE